MSNSTIEIGFAKGDITPELGDPWWIWGKVEKIIDPLHLRVVYLEAKNELPIVLAMADIGALDLTADRQIRQSISDALDLPIERIRINSSHNHSANTITPETQDILDEFGLELYSRSYFERMLAIAAEVAVEARDAKRPARFSAASFPVDRIVANRNVFSSPGDIRVRYGSGQATELREAPIGLVDDKVVTLFVRDLQDNPIVALVNFACHPTVHGASWYHTVHPEFVGYGMDGVEAQTGFPGFFIQGAAGNQTPGKYADNTLESVKVLSQRLADAVHACLDVAAPVPTPTLRLHSWTETIDLRDDMGSEEELSRMLKRAVEDFREQGQDPGSKIWATASMLNVVKNPDRARRIELFAIQSDNWSIVGLPAESVIESGLAIKASLPTEHNLVGAYYGCTQWYIATYWYFRQKGSYETDSGWSYSAPGAAERLTASVIRHLTR